MTDTASKTKRLASNHPNKFDSTSPSWLRKFLNPTFLAFLASLGLTLIYARNVVSNLSSGVLGGGTDGYENMWDDFWVQKALFELGRNPFFTDYMYYPLGTSLRFHTLHPSTGILSAPLWWLFGGIVSTNLVFLLSLVFTCFFAFLLFRNILTQSFLSRTTESAFSPFQQNLAAFGGAALFSFANLQVVNFLAAGQTEKLSAQWLPLYFLFLFRAVRPDPRWWLWVSLSVTTLITLSLTDWQYTIYAVLTTLLYFVFLLFTRRSWAEKGLIFAKLALVGGVYLAIVLVPLLLPMLKEANDSPWLSISEQSVFHSLDLLDYLRPDLTNPGYLALVLIVFGLITGWRQSEGLRFWAICGGMAALMTLGPRLIFAGTITDLPMPYALLYRLPVLSAGRDPQRFYTLVMLAFGVLFAFGLLALFTRLQTLTAPRLPKNWQKQTLLALSTVFVLSLTLLGFLLETNKATVTPPTWPPFYQQLAQDHDKYAILELPTFPAEGPAQDIFMGYATLHQKYRFGGRMARDHKLNNPANLTKTALLFRDFFYMNTPQASLFRPKSDFLPTPDFGKLGLPLLNYYNVRYIVIYNNEVGRRLNEQILALLTQVYGGKLPPTYYEDTLMRVYKVPAVPALPADQSVFLDVGQGWYTAQPQGQQTSRWADTSEDQSAQVLALNLGPISRQVKINFKALNFVPEGTRQKRTLRVALNDQNLVEYTLPEYGLEQDLELSLTLPPGLNHLTFSSPQPALPANPDRNVDGRQLSFRLSDLKLSLN